MKKLSLFFGCICLISMTIFAQSTGASEEKKLYDPNADAKADISAAVKQANEEGKHVLLQIGGNWCVWCLRFNDAVQGNDTLRTTLEENYVVYHLNYSPENKNSSVLEELGYPQRFGFPVFVILDGAGKRMHTQNSAYLEEGKGYDTQEVWNFFRQWSPAALDSKQYDE